MSMPFKINHLFNMSTEITPACPQLPLPIPSTSDLIQIYPSSWIHTQAFQSQFLTTVVHPALIVPARQTAEFKKLISSLLIQRPNQKDVYTLTDEDVLPGQDRNSFRKLVLAEPNPLELNRDEGSSSSSIYHHPLIQQILNRDATFTATHVVALTYEDCTTDQILRRILPISTHSMDIPSAFEVVGSIAHINLREEHLAFQYLIGQVILDKTKNIQLVVNKLSTISNEFRTFPMQVLAIRRTQQETYSENQNHPCLELNKVKKRRLNTHTSSEDDQIQYTYQLGDICTCLPVELKEWGCTFQLDFAQVYWNSRLQFEHQRLVGVIAESSSSSKRNPHGRIVVADACAGVGPFAIPLASRYKGRIQVYANDLNPISYKYLLVNREKNKCTSTMHAYNMDGRLFLRHLDEVQGIQYDHVIMNLPAIAPELLSVFRGWNVGNSYTHRPTLHIYCFVGKTCNYRDEVLKRLSDALGCPLSLERDEVSFHIVRDVSPKKNMVCVSFQLPTEVRAVKRMDTFP